MGLGVGAFLRQIESSPSLVLSFYELNSQPMMRLRLGNSFWDRTDPGYNEVLAWFKSPKTSEIILDGYGLKPDCD
jgi:hypothetical protein